MLLRHVFVYFLSRVLAGAAGLLVVVLLSRLLTPQEYGRYAVAVSVCGVLSLIVFGWLRLALPRYLSGPDAARIRGVANAAFLRLVLLIAAVGVPAVIWVVPDGWHRLSAVALVFLWSQAWFDITRETKRAELHPVAYGALTLSRAALFLSLTWVFSAVWHRAEGVIGALVLATAIPAGLTQLRDSGSNLWNKTDREALTRIRRYGAPLALATVLWALVGSSDRILLLWLMDRGAVGQYSVGYELTEYTLGVLMLVVNLAGFPIAVRALEQHGESEVRTALRKQAMLLLAIATPAAAGFSLLAGDLSRILIGPEFRSVAASVIPWIAWGVFLGGLKLQYVDLAFHLGRRTGLQAVSNLLPLVINIVLNLLWIPRYGVFGAAYATLASYGCALVVGWLLGRGSFPLPVPWREAASILVAAGGMTAALLLLVSWTGVVALVGKILLGALVYGVLLTVMIPRVILPLVHGRVLVRR